MNDEQQDREAFLEVYEKIRFAEGWGGEDLDLPFHPMRHKDVWAIRRRSFKKFQAFVLAMWPETARRGKIAVDAGAGNCWLTRYLSAWGFTAAAIDISIGRVDG